MNHKTFTKLSKVLGVLLLVSTVCNLTSVHAGVPKLINFEGKLTEIDGSPISGKKTITFRIYESADAGIHIWFETREVTIDNGFYNVLLGSDNDFPLSMKFNNAYWLSVEVSGEGEMSPRYQIGAVPYAINADMVDGKDSKELVPIGVIVMWSGTITSIPSGWHLCDGTEGTPDLRDKFVMGAPAGQEPGPGAGSTTHNHGVGTYKGPSHGHSITGSIYKSTAQRYSGEGVGSLSYGQLIQWDHVHTFSLSAATGGAAPITGHSAAAGHLPPYYKIAYIMKL